MNAAAPPGWVQWVSAVTSIVVALATLGLAVLTGVYVVYTRKLADAAAGQLSAAADERDRARASTRRALGVLAEHFLTQVKALAPAAAKRSEIEYRPLLESSLPRMTQEVADLILLARHVGQLELEQAHTAATALADLGAFAARTQSGVGVRLLGTEQDELPKRIASAQNALDWLRTAATR